MRSAAGHHEEVERQVRKAQPVVQQVHRRTQELEAALRENERITGALRQSEERLRHVLEGANDGFWDWNIVTGETLFSNRWLEMRGYSPEDIAPHISSWEKRVHPDDLPHCKRALQAHFSGETSRYQAEYRMRTQDPPGSRQEGRGPPRRRGPGTNDVHGCPACM